MATDGPTPPVCSYKKVWYMNKIPESLKRTADCFKEWWIKHKDIAEELPRQIVSAAAWGESSKAYARKLQEAGHAYTALLERLTVQAQSSANNDDERFAYYDCAEKLHELNSAHFPLEEYCECSEEEKGNIILEGFCDNCGLQKKSRAEIELE